MFLEIAMDLAMGCMPMGMAYAYGFSLACRKDSYAPPQIQAPVSLYVQAQTRVHLLRALSRDEVSWTSMSELQRERVRG